MSSGSQMILCGPGAMQPTLDALAERLSELDAWDVLVLDATAFGAGDPAVRLGSFLERSEDAGAVLAEAGRGEGGGTGHAGGASGAAMWLCGFGEFGPAAVLCAARDQRVAGAACVGAVGIDEAVIQAASEMVPRPLLVIHGLDDEICPVDSARVLAHRAGKAGELRVLGGTGHAIHADPRVVALVADWMERSV